MDPYYIIVRDKAGISVVADSSGRPRTFPKRKKAEKFIAGRPSLRALATSITASINTYHLRWKVDI